MLSGRCLPVSPRVRVNTLRVDALSIRVTTPTLPLRPDLDSLLAALWGVARVDVFTRNGGSGYHWQETADGPEYGANALVLNSGRLQCPPDHHWITADTREAMELLASRDMVPVGWVDDVRRAFDARGSVASVMRSMPPRDRGTLADDGFVVTLIREPHRQSEPTVRLARLTRLDNDWRAGVFREAQVSNGYDESHPLYSVESTLQHLASMWPDPPNMDALVAWLSLGHEQIATAEALARETVARLRPWGAPSVERVVWRVGEWRLTENILKRGPVGDRCPLPVGWPDTVCEVVNEGDFEEAGFEEAGGADVTRWWEVMSNLWRDERPCPYACMVTLKGMGLWIDSITADAITLCVPALA